ncbi:putative MFS-type transporter C09D4.1 [Schistosoma japonicum]|nr:putative MFS-type transporter C09D4.1 [Schistosoma japonicum]
MSKEETGNFAVKLYKGRWFALLIFCFCSFANAYQWIHLNIISDRILFLWSASIPGSSDDVKMISVDWLSMIYMLTYIPLIFPSTWILNRWGLRVTLIVATVLNALGAWIKCVAGILTYETTYGMPDQTTPTSNKFGFPILMIGQTICGIAQSGILGIPAHLAAIWFGENEVSTATALGVFGNQIGVAVGFLIPPLIVPIIPYSSTDANTLDPTVNVTDLFSTIKHYMMILLYFSAALNSLPAILVLFGFRAKPPTEPTLAQYKRNGLKPMNAIDHSHNDKPINCIYTKTNNNGNFDKEDMVHRSTLDLNEYSISSMKQNTIDNNDLMTTNFVVHVDDCVKDTTINDHIYKSIEYDYKSEKIWSSLKRLFKNIPFVLLFLSYGIITGVYYAVSTLLNNILLGYFTDSSLFGWAGFTMVVAGIFGSVLAGIILDKTKKFKLVTCIIYIASLIWMGIFTGTLYLYSMTLVFISMACLGFFMTGYLSIGFELAAELAYPESEGLSSGLLNTSAQIFGLILIHVATSLRTHYGVLPENLFLTGLLVIGSIMTVLIKENLRRQQAYDHMNQLLTKQVNKDLDNEVK